MGGGAHYLEGDMFVGDGIAGEPNGREVTPAKLTDDNIPSVVVRFADGHGVITTLDIILGVLFLGGGLDLFIFGRRG